MTGRWRGPLFIVGCSRSGTTLLQQMLNAHPRIAITPETHFMPFYWAKAGQYGDLGDEAAFRRLVEDIVATGDLREWGLSADEFRAAAWAGERTFAAVLGTILDLFARVKNADIRGEKSPSHVLYVGEIKKVFPEACFVHMVRDPRAVVNSRREQSWCPKGIRENTLFWVEQVSAGVNGARKLGRDWITVRYEDLIQHAEKTLRGVCARFGIEFEPSMLEYWKHNHRLLDLDREPWNINASRPLQPDRVDRWRSQFSRAEVLEIETLAWPLMRTFGYSPVSPWLSLLPSVASRASADAVRSMRRWARELRRRR